MPNQIQREKEREKKPRPQDNAGPTFDGIDIGDTEDLLKDLDVIEHPEKYTQKQRDCGCFSPDKGNSGLR